MVLYAPQPYWRYAIFQIPAILTVALLILALLTNFWGWFPPTVSVQMMLDLSSSTYGDTFREKGTVMEAEIEAVKAYARENINAPNPNLLSLSGFADQIVPITPNFSSNPEEIDSAIERVVQPAISQHVGSGTNLDVAVERGLEALESQSQRCKEMLVVTDGLVQLNSTQIARSQVSGTRLNFLIVNSSIPQNLAMAAKATGGTALPANTNTIKELVAGQFRQRFNSNSKVVNLFLGLAVVSFMWMLVLPIDRFLQHQWNLRFDFSGKIALFNALFWTAAIPPLVGFPVWQGC
jgi:Ca-activated chloride channel homolog